jgi:VanZ family protein
VWVAVEHRGRILVVMDATGPSEAGLRGLVIWAPVIAWAGLIFALSAQPNLRFVPDELLDLIVRKLGHMAVFGILALLLWRAVRSTTAWRRPWGWAVALTVLYAVTDEVHQSFVTGRHASAVDVGIDAAGALIAVGLAKLVVARRARRRPISAR